MMTIRVEAPFLTTQLLLWIRWQVFSFKPNLPSLSLWNKNVKPCYQYRIINSSFLIHHQVVQSVSDACVRFWTSLVGQTFTPACQIYGLVGGLASSSLNTSHKCHIFCFSITFLPCLLHCHLGNSLMVMFIRPASLSRHTGVCDSFLKPKVSI